MARGIARRQRRSAWCSPPTSRPPSTGLCRGNSGGRFPDDMEPHPAGWGICALAVSLLLPPAHLSAQRLRQAAPPKGSIAAGATVQDSLVRRDVLLAAESTYAQQWKLTATAGQIVTIDLVSEAFDADRKSTRLNSSHLVISYAVFCLTKKRYPAIAPA